MVTIQNNCFNKQVFFRACMLILLCPPKTPKAQKRSDLTRVRSKFKIDKVYFLQRSLIYSKVFFGCTLLLDYMHFRIWEIGRYFAVVQIPWDHRGHRVRFQVLLCTYVHVFIIQCTVYLACVIVYILDYSIMICIYKIFTLHTIFRPEMVYNRQKKHEKIKSNLNLRE